MIIIIIMITSQILHSFRTENVGIKIRLLIGSCEQEMLLIWKIEDQDLFQHGVDGGKGELSKHHVVIGIIESFFGFLHPIELVEISYSCT